jgi:hypothetical protein
LLWFGQNIRNGQSELFRWLVYGIALLIPITLAGVRDWSVGTDVLYYGYGVFKDATTAPYINGMDSMWDDWIDIGYLWLNFAVSRITDNLNIVLFLIIFIEIIFVFLCLYQWKDEIPIWLGMFVFYMFFFNLSLNAMRQFLAISIAFYGVKHIFNRNFLYFAFWVMLGFLFHKSIIIVLAFYPLFLYANKFTSNKSKILFSIVFLSSIIFSNQIIIPFLQTISEILPFAQKAAWYLTYVEKDKIPYKNFIYFSFLVILFLYNRKSIFAQFPNIGHFLEIVVISIAITQLLSFAAGIWAMRLIWYANWWICFLIPIIFCSYNKTYSSRITNTALIIFCLFYWYINYIRLDYGETGNYSTVLDSLF